MYVPRDISIDLVKRDALDRNLVIERLDAGSYSVTTLGAQLAYETKIDNQTLGGLATTRDSVPLESESDIPPSLTVFASSPDAALAMALNNIYQYVNPIAA